MFIFFLLPSIPCIGLILFSSVMNKCFTDFYFSFNSIDTTPPQTTPPPCETPAPLPPYAPPSEDRRRGRGDDRRDGRGRGGGRREKGKRDSRGRGKEQRSKGIDRRGRGSGQQTIIINNCF